MGLVCWGGDYSLREWGWPQNTQKTGIPFGNGVCHGYFDKLSTRINTDLISCGNGVGGEVEKTGWIPFGNGVATKARRHEGFPAGMGLPQRFCVNIQINFD